MAEITITYETLYEYLRREKSRDELQPLETTFFQNVMDYLKEKQGILEQSKNKSDLFSITERDKTGTQLLNIRKIIRELYERREKKILSMALNKSRTQSQIVDTSNLLDEETKFFNAVVQLLDTYREDVLGTVLGVQTTPALPVEPKPQPRPAPVPTTKKVQFLKIVSQFVGKELEIYGPYTPAQEAELPIEIADVLISKGSAKHV